MFHMLCVFIIVLLRNKYRIAIGAFVERKKICLGFYVYDQN